MGTDGPAAKAAFDKIEMAEQPQCLRDMLRAIDLARRQSSLYGADHPSTEEALNNLLERIVALVAEFGAATCIFSKGFLIVNDHQYPPTDAREILERLRARGVLGVTFMSGQTMDQVVGFLSFLNVDPKEIKKCGGPSNYLRKQNVTRIVVTEIVYTSGDADDPDAEIDFGPQNVDRAIGAVINWLLKRGSEDDKEDEPAPVLPIGQILSDPDASAKLIREAVTKLHRSRRPGSRGELAHTVFDEMKDLTSDHPEKWDEAAPQVRKAIAKLPSELRPMLGGFMGSRPPRSKGTRSIVAGSGCRRSRGHAGRRTGSPAGGGRTRQDAHRRRVERFL